MPYAHSRVSSVTLVESRVCTVPKYILCGKALIGGVAHCPKRTRRDLLHCDEQSLKISTPEPRAALERCFSSKLQWF